MSKIPELTIRDLMRLQDVSRWQIVRVGRSQSVAEHSWAVGIIAQELWLARSGGKRGEAGTDVELHALANYALWHDVAEVFTGDINTPTKIHLKNCGLGSALADLEATAGRGASALGDEHYLAKECIKLADMLEAIYYLTEYGQGSYARGQRDGLGERLQSYLDTIHPAWRDAADAMLDKLGPFGAETTTFDRIGGLQ